MVPTEDFAIFAQADDWKCTVRKLLTGTDGPLLNLEWKLWARWRQARERLKQQG